MSKKRKGEWRLYRVVGVFVLVAGFVWAGLSFRAFRQEFACKIRLMRVFYPFVCRDESLITPEDLQSTVEETGKGVLTCPKCRLAYTYKPVQGTLYNWQHRARLRMIAWCPRPCHGRRRNVLLESGVAFSIPEALFQKAILAEYTLSADEIIAMDRESEVIESVPDNVAPISD